VIPGRIGDLSRDGAIYRWRLAQEIFCDQSHPASKPVPIALATISVAALAVSIVKAA
jgi:hypothetical protein